MPLETNRNKRKVGTGSDSDAVKLTYLTTVRGSDNSEFATFNIFY